MNGGGTVFECRKCGHKLVAYLDPDRVVCWHWNTPHDLRGKAGAPAVMRKVGAATVADVPMTAGQKAAATRKRNLAAQLERIGA